MKGCLTKIFFALIIISAVAVYVFDKYGKEYYELSKQKIAKSFVEQLEKQIENLSGDVIDDSVKTSFVEKLESIKSENVKNTSQKFDNIISDINNYIAGHPGSNEYLDKIKKTIKEYEQRKKD